MLGITHLQNGKCGCGLSADGNGKNNICGCGSSEDGKIADADHPQNEYNRISTPLRESDELDNFKSC